MSCAEISTSSSRRGSRAHHPSLPPPHEPHPPEAKPTPWHSSPGQQGTRLRKTLGPRRATLHHESGMLHVIPLGGLGEIGLNAMVLACREEMLLIDAGLMFPSETTPGVDFIIPDFTHLRQNASLLKGILLTHG